MKKKSIYFVLFLIVVIAFFLRFWQLGQVPPSPDWDEVALGYNAYSIRDTLRDEYGNFLPIILRSFDDYKPALYAYFVIPFISIFGLNVFAVRLPSVLFGLLTVIGTFFLVRELFKNNKLALVAAFLLAISPLSIQFSRIGFESNVGVALNVFIALLFLKGLKKPFLLYLTSALSGINLYVYQGEKVATPLLIAVLMILFRKELLKIPKKHLLSAVFIGLIISLPIVFYTVTNKESLARASGVSIFSDLTPLLKDNAKRLIVDYKNNDLVGVIFDNRRIIYIKTIISGYLSHFDLNWLFITGDLPRHHAPNMGLLYLWELPFLFFGIYALIFGNFDKPVKAVIFLWFLISPIPASITSGVPHAVRTLNFLPIFQIFIAIGIITSVSSISNIKYKIAKINMKYLIFTLYFLFFLFNFSYYLNQYFIQQNYFHSKFWQYGYKQAVEEVKKREHLYEKIIVSNQPNLDQSYMFFLFYLAYPPKEYQRESKGASGGFNEIHQFSKYEFRPIEWNKEEKDKRFLYVGRPQDFPSVPPKVIQYINFLDGEPAIMIVEG